VGPGNSPQQDDAFRGGSGAAPGVKRKLGAPSVKQQLAAIRMLFNWLVTGQVVANNPAAAARGPKHVGEQRRRLIASIPTTTVRDLRDRALIATLTYGFTRIGAALKMRVEDLRPKGPAWTLRLHEKGGKQHVMRCHHTLAEMLHAYIAAAGMAEDKKAYLFRASRGQGPGRSRIASRCR
jgi:site-specific recombinase XerD